MRFTFKKGSITGTTLFPIPTAASESKYITTGPVIHHTTTLWFTEFSGGKIGEITA